MEAKIVGMGPQVQEGQGSHQKPEEARKRIAPK